MRRRLGAHPAPKPKPKPKRKPKPKPKPKPNPNPNPKPNPNPEPDHGPEPNQVRILHRHHFSSELQRMSTVVEVAPKGGGAAQCRCLLKGSPEAVHQG